MWLYTVHSHSIPQVYISAAEVDLDTAYLGVPLTRRVTMVNLSNLEASSFERHIQKVQHCTSRYMHYHGSPYYSITWLVILVYSEYNCSLHNDVGYNLEGGVPHDLAPPLKCAKCCTLQQANERVRHTPSGVYTVVRLIEGTGCMLLCSRCPRHMHAFYHFLAMCVGTAQNTMHTVRVMPALTKLNDAVDQ